MRSLSTLTLKRYYRTWVKKNPGKEYNDMIKSQINVAMLDDAKESVEEVLALL